MTAAEPVGGAGPRSRLAISRDLARRVRHRQRATWFPPLVFALVTYIAIPVTRAGHATGLVCAQRGGAPPRAIVCVAHNSAAFVYWPIALLAAYAVIAAFYVRLGRSRGVGTRTRPYLLTGLVLAVAVIAAAVWSSHRVITNGYDLFGWHVDGPQLYRVIAPAFAIGLALLMLAAVDHSIALALATIAYLVISLGRVDFGWTLAQNSPWSFAPHLVIEATVLLLGSGVLAWWQRRARSAVSS